jgi:glycosyltransferase involved in cell wall biosynthesis
MRVDVSICIATYRRPVGLVRLLGSLGRAKLPGGVGVEAIVVDNDPAADPARPVAADVSLPGISLRRLREPRRSLVYARSRAIEAARGRWLAFVDDDAMIEEGWLDALWRCVEERDADGFFGAVLPRVEDAARLQNALLRRQLFRDAGFDPVLRADASERQLLREFERRGARFESCDGAVVLGSARPHGRPGLARRLVERSTRRRGRSEERGEA